LNSKKQNNPEQIPVSKDENMEEHSDKVIDETLSEKVPEESLPAEEIT
jgi:hypothetical protein|tara:strand:- start:842 stop:985 length:144 start_codon:yes stop_codon:yes gene_type:complete